MGVNKPSRRVLGSGFQWGGVPGALSLVTRLVSTSPALTRACTGTGKGQSWWEQRARSCATSRTWQGTAGAEQLTWLQGSGCSRSASQVVLDSKDEAVPLQTPGDAGLHVLPCFGRNRCNLFVGCLKGIRKRSVVRIRMTCFKSALK